MSGSRSRRLSPVMMVGYGLIGLLWVAFVVMTLFALR